MTSDPLPAPRKSSAKPEIPGYEIAEVIGRGAAGIVYRARQRAVDREVALKVLHPHLRDEPRIVRRIQREARTSARLAHPHVVTAVDMGETADGLTWFAMELVEGPSLALRLRQEGRLKEREALRLFIPLCEALEHLCDHGVVHRDIKPANILIDHRGGARLADLGLAFHEDDPTITAQGGTLGTPHYISPEQAVDPTQADTRSDIWSFGATLYHVLCGRPPFPGESAAEILSAVLYGRVPDPLELEPSLSKRLGLVLRKCLTRDPEGRYQSPRELLLDLERVRERRAPRVSRSQLDPVERRGEARRSLWVAAAVVVALGTGLGGLLWLREGPSDEVLGADARPAASLPLERIARSTGGGVLPAALLLELEELEAGLGPDHAARLAEVRAGVEADLRRRVRDVRTRLETEIRRALGEGNLADAGRRLTQELAPALLSQVGFPEAELERRGVSLTSWRSLLEAEVQVAADVAERDFLAALETWAGDLGVEAGRLAGENRWEAALGTLALGDPTTLLERVGVGYFRLPLERVSELAEPVRIELDLRRQRLEEEWGLIDGGLVEFLTRRAATLAAQLEQGPPRIRAAEQLAADFEAELFDRRLTLEHMPRNLPRESLVALVRERRALSALEDRWLEEDAREDFASSQVLAQSYLSDKSYAAAAELWQEAGERLSLVGERTQGAWHPALSRRVRVRAGEARLVAGFLELIGERLRQRSGSEVDLVWRSIQYPSVRIEVGPEPLRDGLRVRRAGLPEVITLRELDGPQLERLAGFGGPPQDLEPLDRLRLALFRFHDGRVDEASAALGAGPRPTSPVALEVLPDLAGRISTALEERRGATARRAEQAQELLDQVFDPARQVESPRLVVAQVGELLRRFDDLELVRARRAELISLRSLLERPAEPDVGRSLVEVYRPDTLTTPRFGRVLLGYDLQKPQPEAFELGDWVFDGVGHQVSERAVNWTALREQKGLRLALLPPLDTDTFEVTLRLEAPSTSGPPQLLLVSAAGFHVALVGTGLPGGDRRPRILVGTEPLPAFLGRLQAGEGDRQEQLLERGRVQVLHLRVSRPAGRLTVELDGRRLEQTSSLLPPSDETNHLELRSWEPVRVLSLELEAGR